MVLIEAAIDSLADAERVVREGAGRLEVCGDLSVGGVTPSRKLLRACLGLGIPCVAMARPRGGDFVHDDLELQQVFADASGRGRTGRDAVLTAMEQRGALDVVRAREALARPLPSRRRPDRSNRYRLPCLGQVASET